MIAIPDGSTIAVIAVNIAGWAVTVVYNIWRNSVRNYQHKAMWEEYAEKHKIPVNGRG